MSGRNVTEFRGEGGGGGKRSISAKDSIPSNKHNYSWKQEIIAFV